MREGLRVPTKSLKIALKTIKETIIADNFLLSIDGFKIRERQSNNKYNCPPVKVPSSLRLGKYCVSLLLGQK